MKFLNEIFVGNWMKILYENFPIDLFDGIHGWKHLVKWLDEFSRLFVWMNFHMIT